MFSIKASIRIFELVEVPSIKLLWVSLLSPEVYYQFQISPTEPSRCFPSKYQSASFHLSKTVQLKFQFVQLFQFFHLPLRKPTNQKCWTVPIKKNVFKLDTKPDFTKNKACFSSINISTDSFLLRNNISKSVSRVTLFFPEYQTSCQRESLTNFYSSGCKFINFYLQTNICWLSSGLVPCGENWWVECATKSLLVFTSRCSIWSFDKKLARFNSPIYIFHF